MVSPQIKIAELKHWVAARLANNRKFLSTAVRNSATVQQALVLHTTFLDVNPRKPVTFSQRCYHVHHNMNTIPLCQCGNELGFDKQVWAYSSICSRKCYQQTTISTTFKEAISKKYGVTNYSKTDAFKEQVQQYNLKKHGVAHYQSTDEFKQKSAETSLAKYGVAHAASNPAAKLKRKKTLTSRYGVDSYSKTPQFKARMRQHCEERNADGLPFSGHSYKFKDYVTPAGNVLQVQGYENHALDELFATHESWEVLASTHIVSERLGKIWYKYDENEHRYYPDIFIPKYNRVIEVKSQYYYYKDFEKNQEKKKAVQALGFAFEFWVVCTKKGMVTITKY